jgi:hypothetical protein
MFFLESNNIKFYLKVLSNFTWFDFFLKYTPSFTEQREYLIVYRFVVVYYYWPLLQQLED